MPDYRIVGERCSVEISGRSSLHDIHGKARPGAVSGKLTAAFEEGALDASTSPSGTVEVAVAQLGFGNAMYDRELPKRMDTARYPTATVTLAKMEADGAGAYQARLALTLHGVTKEFDETVHVKVDGEDTLTVSGEHRFDIRDFDIEPPKKLGLRVHPEFTVRMTLVATAS